MLYVWKFISHAAGFLAVAVGETEEKARARIIAICLKERGEAEAEKIKSRLDLCEVERFPADKPGFICWSGV